MGRAKDAGREWSGPAGLFAESVRELQGIEATKQALDDRAQMRQRAIKWRISALRVRCLQYL